MEFAERLKKLGIENAFNVLGKVLKLREQGKDVISFCIGEPDFDTPENIKKAAIEALNNNMTHYGPSGGLPVFKRTIAQYISKTRKINVGEENVCISAGAKAIIYYTIHSLLNPGDEAIYPNPGYPTYESVINFVEGKAIPLPLLESKEFSFDVNTLMKLITEKTKLIIINTPQNPTGGFLSKKDLQAIADIAIKNNIFVLSDEIYSRILYEGEFNSIVSIPGMLERTILVDGFSKTYAMTGWRLGFGVANKELIQELTNLENNCVACTTTFNQFAGIEALTGPQDSVIEMVKKYRERRDLIVDLLNSIRGISCLKPKGSFYVFPNVTQACRNLGLKDADELQDYLLNNYGVAVLARTSFGKKNKDEAEEYIRISYATSKDNIREGLKRIKQALEK
ncbi:MAG: pyridoxal phosphate-dependent aminotransferase [Actinobacteria bacterium]|nr:pyridoxal phosphate-dependent aminotransferase [Actinomycetota bacterium]